jgi:Ca-activated chloride channel family protein
MRQLIPFHAPAAPAGFASDATLARFGRGGSLAQANLRALLVVARTLAAAVILLCLLAVLAPEAIRDARSEVPRAPSGLFFKSGLEDRAVAAPLLATEVDIEVNGPVARARVRQHFLNPSDYWLEGSYVFPLPEGAAVDRLTLEIGDRRIEGQVAEKQAAREIYEKAVTKGRRASLLESERPNVFFTSVANVAPREPVTVEIEFRLPVELEGAGHSLRFPMTVAPRYTPEAPLTLVGRRGGGAHRAGGEAGQGRDLFGPVADPRDGGPYNPLTLTVILNPALPVAELVSAYHPMTAARTEDGRISLELASGPVEANRDFLLTWMVDTTAGPRATVFAEELGCGSPETGDCASYVLVQLLPSQAEAKSTQPRDLVLVLDTSGSMAGPSMEQARRAVGALLSRLRPEDRFNIVAFADDSIAFAGASQEATEASVARARTFVATLEANGGTNMMPALSFALREQPVPGRLRQIVFLTDGAVGNEEQVLDLLHARLGGSRLFTVGIGSAPNDFFMKATAAKGRGDFTYISDQAEVAERMATLFEKLETPVLTDVTAEWPDLPAAPGVRPVVLPEPLPDLYADRPVVFSARYPGIRLADLEGTLRLAGSRGGEAWAAELPLDTPLPAAGIAAVWGRTAFDRAMAVARHGHEREAQEREALEIALDHHLVTRLTSLVAVDESEVARPADAPVMTAEIARSLPAGWDYDKVFGKQPRLHLRKLPKSIMRAASLESQTVALPQTATPGPLWLLAGMILVLAGGTLIFLAFRRGGPSHA